MIVTGSRPPRLVLLICAFLVAPASRAVCIDRDGDRYPRGSACTTTVDCDDGDLSRFPGAAESCNGVDDDCDGTLDEGCDGVCDEAERRFGTRLLGGADGLRQTKAQVALARHGYGVVWTNYLEGGPTCSELRFGRVDEFGELRTSPSSLRVPGYPGNPSLDSAIIWTGKSFVVGWTADESPACTSGISRSSAVVQFIEPDGSRRGKPIHVRQPAAGRRSSLVDLLWNGEYVVAVVFDSASDDYEFFRISQEGDVLDPEGWPLGLAGLALTIRPGFVSWTGHGYALVFADESDAPVVPPDNFELFIIRYDENFAALDAEPIRLTNESLRSAEPSVTWADGEWGIAWEQHFAESVAPQIAFMRVSSEGEVVTPPGIVPLTVGSRAKQFVRVHWSGDEYGILYHEDTGPVANPAGDLFFGRLTRLGEGIEPARLITTDSAFEAGYFSSQWTGSDYVVLWDDGSANPLAVRFDRMGCGCEDADGDSFSTCAGGDCEDGRADINVLGSEICGDGLDNDCDGLVDCSDGVACPAMGPPAPEVTGVLALAGTSRFFWDPLPEADTYDVTRGQLSDLHFESDARHGECLANGLTEPELEDESVPLLSDGFFYLVRASTGSTLECRQGTWGSELRDTAISACP